MNNKLLNSFSKNKFTYQYIDGEFGTYDTIINGTYTYFHSELILKTQEGILTAMVINENNICLDSGIDCKKTSSEFLVKL